MPRTAPGHPGRGLPSLWPTVSPWATTKQKQQESDDPSVFTRPWTMRIGQKRRPEEETWESACWEGNPDPDVWLKK